MVAGSANGAGWLVAEDRGRVPGVWAVAPRAARQGIPKEIVGTIWDEDSDGGARDIDGEVVAVDAFHWPPTIELDHGN